jgi:hypothetical protein
MKILKLILHIILIIVFTPFYLIGAILGFTLAPMFEGFEKGKEDGRRLAKGAIKLVSTSKRGKSE